MRIGSAESDQELHGAIVYVVDDDGELRRSLHFLLETHNFYVSPFASGIEFIGHVQNLRAAPIILDLRMPQMDGIQVLSELARRQIKWPVIVLSGHGEVAVAVQSLKLGAIDFLEKPASAADLLSAIERAFQQLTSDSADDNRRERAAARMAVLTRRELEVLDHLCQGRSNKQVAFDLSISPRTVEMHRANALRQLNLRSLVEVAELRSAAQS